MAESQKQIPHKWDECPYQGGPRPFPHVRTQGAGTIGLPEAGSHQTLD